MTQFRKHASAGKGISDNAEPSIRDNASSREEFPAEVPQPAYWKLLLSGLAIIICMAALKWTDVVEWKNGAWRLKPKREAERDKQMKKIDDAEQYALIADVPGYYECLHCATRRMFLKTNEVWKYGVTNQGEKLRYTTQFLEQRRLRYLVQLRGTYSQCLLEEKRKLFEYPLLPENLTRPDSLKLVLPPGNLQMR